MNGKKILSSTEPGEVRKFGLIAFVFFGGLSAVTGVKGRLIFAGLFGVFSLTGLLNLMMPVLMTPVYRLWIRVGDIIGTGVTIVLLTIVYYLMITPYAIILRVFGKHLLPVRPDKRCDSYWVARPEPAQPADRFYKRY